MSDTSTSTKCDCQSCPQEIRILLDGPLEEFEDYMEFHAARYKATNPNIRISLFPVENLEERLLNSDDWDGAIFPGQLIGTLVKQDLLWDLSHFVRSSETLDWPGILPFFRNPSSVFGSDQSVPRLIPLDGDVISMYYRKDLFDQFNIAVPRTWQEYNEAAAFFHGQPLGPGGAPLSGSCVAREKDCGNEYWTALILSSMTQTFGTSSGFFLDPSSLDPLFGPAMEETLRLMREQLKYGHDKERTGDCLESNFALNRGECALTYAWGSQMTVSSGAFDIGVAPTPGSAQVLDRDTQQLVNCTVEVCPYGDYYEDIGVVNKAPYSAFGGWSAGISNQIPEATQYAVADFFAYVSNSTQSLDDIFPNDISTFVQPYRQSHLNTVGWIQNGFGGEVASEYTNAVRGIHSENAVLELRVASAGEMRKVIDQQVTEYIDEVFEEEVENDLPLRKLFTERMEEGIMDIVATENRGQVVKLSESYRESIGFSNLSEEDYKNFINGDFRDAAWGLSGLMCVTALALLFWTIRHRNNKVMQAFQPFLLIQSSVGLLILSLSIIPLGFDDSGYSVDVLNVTCMLSPWLYVVGFTVFFSSVYSKIRECIKIYKAPHEHDCLMVQPKSALRLCLRLLILNGTLLGLWTGLDPLTWQREEIEGGVVLEDGTVETYGSCRGGYTALGFAISIYLLNILITMIASLQAFKCRFLVLEYNEMQWLPLSVFPFLEVWVIGGPILPLVRENPTVTFMVLTMVVVVSTVVGGMAVFAPKDWYIRKYYYNKSGPNKRFPERTSSAGIMVLKHPTVECQREVEDLSFKLEQLQGWNTELEIEIRVMKERVKEVSGNTKLQLRETLLNSATADSDTREGPTSRGDSDHHGIGHAMSHDEELEAVERFQRVWKMPEEEEDEEPPTEAIIPKSGSLKSLLQEDPAGALSRGIEVEPSPKLDGDDTYASRRHVSSGDAGSNVERGNPLARLAMMDDENDSRSQDPLTMDDESDDGPQDPLARIAMMDDESNDEPEDPLARVAMMDDDSSDGPQDPLKSVAMMDDESDDGPQDPLTRVAMMDGDRNDVPQDPLLRVAMMDDDSSDGPQDPLRRVAMMDDESDDGPQDPLTRVAMMDGDRNDVPQDPLLRVAMMDDDSSDGPQDPLRRVAMMDDEGDDGPQDPLAGIAMMDDESFDEPKDPLARVAMMDDEEKKDPSNPPKRLQKAPSSTARTRSKNPLKESGSRLARMDSRIKKEEESPQDIVARIIAMKLAAADEDDSSDGDDSRNSTPEDPLARIMSMETTMTQESDDPDVPSLDYQYADDDGDDEDVIIKKKDFRDLSSMIKDDDLEELERRAALLADSVKTKLEVSQYADLSRDSVAGETDSGPGYSALAKRTKDSDRQSRSIGGLDISKISVSDEGDNRFVSVPESILQSPDEWRAPESSDGSNQSPPVRLSAGEASADIQKKENRTAELFEAPGESDSRYATQLAGEPSEGESRRADTREDMNGQTNSSFNGGVKSPATVEKPKIMLSPKAEEPPAPTKSYMISDWIAVGGLAGALLAESDSQSTSSYADSSLPDSVTSMEATTRASELEIPMANEIDNLVVQKDWDGVKEAATKYEVSAASPRFKPVLNAPQKNTAALEEKRRKKRELEAWKSSLSKSFETEKSVEQR